MVRRGLFPSREQARRAIENGDVVVGGAPTTKASRLVAPAEPIRLLGPPPAYVGRGGLKLEGALDRFGIDPSGRRALDVGASTGGFTDCLLQRGATSVVALDVGRGQLHERLRADPRVTVLERTNIREVDPAAIGAPFDLVVTDVSFISLHAVLDALLSCAGPGAELVVLVKPQFEAGRADVSRGRGVISDPEIWRRVLDDVGSAIERRGAAIMGAMVSPLQGADGNVEFLLHLRAPGGATGGGIPATMLPVDALVREAAGITGADDADPAAGET